MTSAPPPLARRLRPAGPVVDANAAERLYETLRAAAQLLACRRVLAAREQRGIYP